MIYFHHVIRSIALIAVFFSTSGCITDDVAHLQHIRAAEDSVLSLFVATDEREWEKVQSHLKDQVLFDMTSIVGGDPVQKTAKSIVEDWKNGLQNLKAIHHQVSNFQTTLDGKTAEVRCYAITTHYRPHASGRNTRTFVGTYKIDLEHAEGKWLISGFKFDLKYVNGNLDLHKD